MLEVPVAGNRQRQFVDGELPPQPLDQIGLVELPVEEKSRIPPVEAQLVVGRRVAAGNAPVACCAAMPVTLPERRARPWPSGLRKPAGRRQPGVAGGHWA